MAFILKIVAETKNGQEIEIEPSWWNKDELKSSHSFKEEVNHNYLDYFLFVNKQTRGDIAQSQEKYRNKGIYEYEGWVKVNDRTKVELDELTQNLEEGSKIKIWIYEWESGHN